ncbi:unnamed protein product [Blepharisma stoltei]|uniref:R3H domain-containing protein n=1 Tax=Blepharisma stoltei TaxID=1481888 RepID=A0AAU9J6V0_9CILI|nr:unnamed protein product [Blepharisma stoltei]
MEEKTIIPNTLFASIKGNQNIKDAITQEIEKFLKNAKATTLLFPPDTAPNVRKFAHQIAEAHGLIHESRDSENGRELCISKKSIQQLPADPIISLVKTNKNSVTVNISWNSGGIYSVENLCIKTTGAAEKEIEASLSPDGSWTIPEEAKLLDYSDCHLKLQTSQETLNLTIRNLTETKQVTIEFSDLQFSTKYNLTVHTFNQNYKSEDFPFIFCTLPNAEGKLYTWGNNEDARQGIEQTKIFMTPIPHPAVESSFVEVATNYGSNLGINTEGSLYVWGAILNENRQEFISLPFILEPKISFYKIACGYRFFGAISLEGDIYTWGNGEYGELGLGSVRFSSVPLRIESFNDERTSHRFFTDISCSDYSYLACNDEGLLYEWGACFNPLSGVKAMLDKPHINKSVSSHKIAQVSCGVGYYGVVTQEKVLLMWGENLDNQVGFDDCRILAIPRPLDIENVVQVSCGISHTGCVTADGDVWLWGKGKLGQLGGNYEDSSVPRKLEEIKGKKVSVNGKCTIVLGVDGRLYSFGEGKNGCLGIGVGGKSAKPRKVKITNRAISVSLGIAHSIALVE